ncbi:MAG: trypsin-like peptidase domain-containing protein [Flavobacteriales bacterium]|jgi:serine protease Do|nr:trypsin-like peptidase domain-containing protein [Flavobacteriales bacterium]
MKKIGTLILASALGGALTLGSYKLFLEKDTAVNATDVVTQTTVKSNLVNYALPAENTDFTIAADATLAAVVHVKNVSVQEVQDPISSFFYGGSSTRELKQVGTGSGVIISKDGYIITNNHVIENAKTLEITLNDKRKYNATIIGADPNTDIALVKIDEKDLPYIPFGNSDNVKVGEWVLAVGNPFNLSSTVTAGIISAKGRNININKNNRAIESFIQTDAVVNPGNSGGALVNTRGELIGINSAIESITGSYMGYSFAVPSNIAKKVIEDMMLYGNVQRAYLGINVDDLNADKAKIYEIPNTEGVIIVNVLDESAAVTAGLKKNDVIIKMDDVAIKNFADLSGYIGSKRPGDKISITFVRGGITKTIPLTLKNRFGKETVSKTDYVDYYIGETKVLSDTDKSKFNIDFGVKIIKLKNKELLAKGLQNNDIILAINDVKIYSVNELSIYLKNNENKDYVTLQILNHQGRIGYVSIRLD